MAEAAKQTQGKTYETPVNSSISFNGKQYGPFKQVSQFFLTPEGKNFYAVVTEDSKGGMTLAYRMISSASSSATFGTRPCTPVLVFCCTRPIRI